MTEAAVDVSTFAKQAQQAMAAENAEVNAAQTGETPVKPEPAVEPKPKAPATGDLDSLKARWARGEHEAVLRELAGKDADFSKARLPGSFAALREQRRAILAREVQVKESAGRLAQAHQKFVDAQAAFEAGDIESAIQKAFGVDATEFGRRHVHSLSKAPPDPTVAALKKELEEFKKSAAERERMAEETRTRAAQEQAAVQEKKALSEYLADTDYSKVAARPAFLDRIVVELRAHLDEETGVSCTVVEAAEAAYKYLYGDDEPSGKSAKPAREKKPLPPPRSGSARTEPEFAPGSKELLEHWVEQARRASLLGE